MSGFSSKFFDAWSNCWSVIVTCVEWRTCFTSRVVCVHVHDCAHLSGASHRRTQTHNAGPGTQFQHSSAVHESRVGDQVLRKRLATKPYSASHPMVSGA